MGYYKTLKEKKEKTIINVIWAQKKKKKDSRHEVLRRMESRCMAPVDHLLYMPLLRHSWPTWLYPPPPTEYISANNNLQYWRAEKNALCEMFGRRTFSYIQKAWEKKKKRKKKGKRKRKKKEKKVGVSYMGELRQRVGEIQEEEEEKKIKGVSQSRLGQIRIEMK
jgi:hypothetical protein